MSDPLPADELTKIYEKFNILGQQITKIDTVVAQFDRTFEKLTEVSHNVSKILAVQENRMETQERHGTELQRSMEERRKEVDEKIKSINETIDKNEADLRQYMSGIRKELFAHHSEMKKSIQKIERWMWMVVGAGTAVGIIIGLVEKFLS